MLGLSSVALFVWFVRFVLAVVGLPFAFVGVICHFVSFASIIDLLVA